MKIEDYIKLRKKHDGLDETDHKRKDENIRRLIDYIFDYYKLLEEGQSTSEKSKLKGLRRNVNYQYEIESYSDEVQRWLLKIFNEYNIKINRQLVEVLDEIDFFLLISDAKDWEKLSYDLYTLVTKKHIFLSDHPLEILAFAKDYYKICNKKSGLSLSQYKLNQKSKRFIKDIYSEYGINLVAWSKAYLNYFYSSITLWPLSHRIVTEENGKRVSQYDYNATRNVFALNSVLGKISESNGAYSYLKKNKMILVELLRKESLNHEDKIFRSIE